LRRRACAPGLVSLATISFLLWFGQSAHAEVALHAAPGSSLAASGDFRLRLESDWDSMQSSNVPRDDRTRLRVRARVALEYKQGERLSAGLRLRSGSNDSQQSGHITIYDFDGNSAGDAQFNLDRWYLRYRSDGFTAWAGRDTLPYWKQDELFWDDDATAAGLAGSYAGMLGRASVTLNGGVFSAPAGMQAFSGQLALAQAVWDRQFDRWGLTVAGGIFNIDGDPENQDAQRLLLDGNGARDYRILALQLQLRGEWLGKALVAGADYGVNVEEYSGDVLDAFTDFHQDQDTAYAVFLHWGQAEQRGQWLLGYYYAHVETLAVNSSYVQDDWVRWGNSAQIRSSNFEGHELRAAYALSSQLNIMGRLFLVDAITERAADSTAKEDGKRFRLDLNVKF